MKKQVLNFAAITKLSLLMVGCKSDEPIKPIPYVYVAGCEYKGGEGIASQTSPFRKSLKWVSKYSQIRLS